MPQPSRCLPAVVVCLMILLGLCGPAAARVTSTQCNNCHTMHNSQVGLAADDGETSGKMREADELFWWYSKDYSRNSPKFLLVTTCLSCHTNVDNGDTIKKLGGQDVPIVFNATTEPDYNKPGSSSNALAGGNFYWVAQWATAEERVAAASHGHNPCGIGIYSKDPTPGKSSNKNGCGFYCHDVLQSSNSGCTSCHNCYHHTDRADHPYRFLLTHYRDLSGGSMLKPCSADWIAGYEDLKWEQDPTKGHNEYKGVGSGFVYDPTFQKDPMYAAYTGAISNFCGGCHGGDVGGTGNLCDTQKSGTPSCWTRHPAHVEIPNEGEFTVLNGAAYNPLVPVARQWARDAFTAPSDTIKLGDGGDVVMCLTCHRAHGSPYRSMLRWPYYEKDEKTGKDKPQPNPATAIWSDTGGCTFCHRDE
ncbi:MAG: hypothetical protein V2A77_11795 [Pseudomonadota bacterium]